MSGWWFDGGYEHIHFNEDIASLYADAVKRGNPKAIVTFNPGVSLIRHTQAEDYTAGELNDPFERRARLALGGRLAVARADVSRLDLGATQRATSDRALARVVPESRSARRRRHAGHGPELGPQGRPHRRLRPGAGAAVPRHCSAVRRCRPCVQPTRIKTNTTQPKIRADMKTIRFKTKQFVTSFLVAFGLNTFITSLLAQPVVNYTVAGTPGQYTLDFTVNNTTPGTAGFDIYYLGVLANGGVSGSPPGYSFTSYATVHYVEVPNAYWPFNDIWIDPTQTLLPTGSTLSGFKVLVTDATPPASIPYFAFGYDFGAVYTGPDNLNLGNPANPLFEGYAVGVVPEPTATSMLVVASLVLLFGKTRFRKCSVTHCSDPVLHGGWG